MTKTKKTLEGKVMPRQVHFSPEMCDQIIEVADNGGHVAKMCSVLGIKSRDTFYRWIKEYPEFAEAYETAKLRSQAFYEDLLLAGTLGKVKNFNFNGLAMTLNNKFGDEYKRNSSGSNTEINIGSINSIEKMDSKQLDQKIEKLQKKLGLLDAE